MASMRGRSEVSSYIAGAQGKIIKQLLRGAARAGAKVIADDAKARSESDTVAEAIVIRTRVEEHRIVVRITVKSGWAYARALWLEYGTSPHFISVSEAQRNGQGIQRINAKVGAAGGDASLVIGGEFVGTTVWHPGARAHPFLRPALDIKANEAVQAAQKYINARVSRAGIVLTDEEDDE